MGWEREERELSVEGPETIPSPVDPDYECVRIDVAAGGKAPAAPPPGGEPDSEGPRLCPDGYVPRRRRRKYKLDGKRIRPSGTPQRNPRG